MILFKPRVDKVIFAQTAGGLSVIITFFLMKLHDRVEIVFWQHTTACSKGFKLWNQKEKLLFHVGGVNSAHNQAVKKSEDIIKEKQYI